MLKIELGVEDLANTRFAISPLTETVFSLLAITDPSRHTLHLPWLRSIRARLDPDDRDLLHALVGPDRIPHEYAGNPSRPVPDFLTPRPERFAPPLGSAHLLGTARMGDDPRTSVTDAFGRLHTVPNVVVADGSVFPSSGGANPTLTIMALALRAARAI